MFGSLEIWFQCALEEPCLKKKSVKNSYTASGSDGSSCSPLCSCFNRVQAVCRTAEGQITAGNSSLPSAGILSPYTQLFSKGTEILVLCIWPKPEILIIERVPWNHLSVRGLSGAHRERLSDTELHPVGSNPGVNSTLAHTPAIACWVTTFKKKKKRKRNKQTKKYVWIMKSTH